MQGKICLITGANSGIGKAIAIGLAKQGATVVIICRDLERGKAAQAEIIAASGNPSVDLLIADLASQAEIRRVVAEFKTKYQHLHVLVNNAAVSSSVFIKTVDGFESNFAINHLAPFLLTHLLLDTLKHSAPARIINITSAAQSVINFDAVTDEKQFESMGAYSQSKMANTLFTYELARKLEGTGITVNCVHPGLIRTNLGRDVKGFFKIVLGFILPFMASPDKGAETPLYLASSKELEGVTGNYFVNKKIAKSSPESYDKVVQERLWNLSEQWVKV